MTEAQINDDRQLKEDSYKAYRWDKHLTPETIQEILPLETRQVLTYIWTFNPSALAFALAEIFPCTEDTADELERRIQARLGCV